MCEAAVGYAKRKCGVLTNWGFAVPPEPPPPPPPPPDGEVYLLYLSRLLTA